MTHAKTGDLLQMPQHGEHFFTEIAFQLVPEVDYGDLVYLSKIVMMKGEVERYSALRDVLRKIQWAKLAGLEAIDIERKIAAQMEPRTVPLAWTGQARHAKAMIECVIHTKAALDSLAVFLTDFLSLPAKGGQRDFRAQRFRQFIPIIMPIDKISSKSQDNVNSQHR